MSGSSARWAGSLLAVVVALGAAAKGEAAATRLPGHVLPALAGAEALPASVDPTPLTLTIVLTRDHQAGFERYLRDVYDPASPTYRRFLTQRQVADRFGPSRRTYDRMRHYMRTSGLRIVAESDNRLTLTVRGNRTTVARAFDVQVADYRLGERTFHATADEPALPRELAAHVQAIGGLSNLAQVQPSKKALRRGFFKLACQLLLAPVAPPLGYKVCLPSDNPTEPYKLCLTAAEQAAENDTDFNYDFFASTGYYQYSRIVLLGESCPPGTVGSARAPRSAGTSRVETPVSGAGQTIAIVGFDSFEQSDIADYLALLGLPAPRLDDLSHVRVNGGAPLGPDQDEVLLDVTTAMTVAPKAKVVVVDAPFTGAGSFQALFNAAIGSGATVISNSWAYCENDTSLADVQSLDAIFQSAAASGISVFNGTGDAGSTCLNGSPNTVSVPAGSPNATAVGGSAVTSGQGKTYLSETWWDGSTATPPTGQGGFGVSRFFDRPAYQSGLTSSGKRSVPDVVANADPANGVMICQASAGGCPTGALYGGTSYTAPLWAAYTALINQALGRNLGFVNPALYALAGTPAFRDAARLSTDFAHVGLGSPNVDQLIVRLGGSTVGAPDAQASLVSPALETQLVGSGTTPIEVPADGTSKGYVVVTLLDIDRHAVAGHTVTLTGNPSGAVTITPASGVSDDHGEVVFTVTNATAQDVIFTATADGTPLAMRPTIPFVVPTAAAGGIVASPPTVAADGVAVATISVTLRDALGRPTPGKEVRLSQGTGHSLITAPSPSVTGANGQIDFTASNLVNETVTYTAVDVTDDELPVPGGPQVTFNGGTGAACGQSVTPSTGANGYTVTTWATGFKAEPFNYGNVNWMGCPGVSEPAFKGDSAFLVNFRTGGVYKLGLDGGAASSADLLGTSAPTLGSPVFGKDGRLYATRSTTTGGFTTGSVVELDQTNGTEVRTLAANLRCPGGLVVDPLSGDLFFDGQCFGGGSDDPNVYRVRHPGTAPTSAEVYAPLPFTPNGQLAFAPNGTLYVVSGYNNPTPSVVRLGGTDTPAPAAVTVPGVVTDFWVGIGEVRANGDAKSLILHDTTGLQLVDITTTPPTKTLLATGPIGAGRTGPDGCLYAGSSDAVLKLTDPTGGCSFSPSIASPSLGLTPAAITPDPSQGDARTFSATIRNLDAPAGTPIRFQVSGANAQVKLVRTDANRQALLTYTAMKTGRDTIVATTAVGATALTSNRARVRWTAGKHVTALTLNLSPTAGASGQAVTVTAALADVSADPNALVAGASIDFALGASRCTAVTDGQGRASCPVTLAQPKVETLTASFAGSAALVAAVDAVGFTVSCPAGLDGVTCYLTAFRGTLQAAPASDVKKGVRKQLLGKVGKLEKQVAKARVPGKKGAKATKKLGKQLDALGKRIGKLNTKKMAAALKTSLSGLVASARASVP